MQNPAAFFNREAARYDAAYEAPGPEGHTLRARLAVALRLLGDGPGDVLDIGMGAGRLCAELAQRGWTVAGADGSERMVELARARLPEAQARLLRARAEALPFGDASFDAVVSTGAFEHVDDLPGALAEVSRVLRPGGRAVVSFANYRAPLSLWRRHVLYPLVTAAKRVVPFRRPPPLAHRRPLSRAAFERLLAAASLDVSAVEYAGVRVRPAGVAELLEGRGGLVGRVLATQLVYSARRLG